MDSEDRAAVETAVVSTVLDYFEGWFGGDTERMQRALHPGLAKRFVQADGYTLDETTAAWMIDATGRGVGLEQSRGDDQIEVTVQDIYRGIANATVRSAVYREYVQLALTPEGWRIVNALWVRT